MQSRPLGQLGFSEARLAQVTQVSERYVEAGEIAGIVIAIARHNALAQLSAHGTRNLETGAPMTVDSLFRIYSMTKPITSAATLLLYERALLRLTDPLSLFFPEFAEMEVYLAGDEPPFRTTPANREITIWDLLTHTAGLAYGIGDEHPVEKVFERTVWGFLASDPERTLAEMADEIARLPLVHQPGTTWRYSIACDLLAAVIEKITGTRYSDFVHDELLSPLGMEETWFTAPPEVHERIAAVYQKTDAGLEPAEDPPVMSYFRARRHPNGGGGLISSATDYLRFATLLLNRGRTEDRQILSPQTVSMMMTNHLPARIDGWREPSTGFGFGGSVVTSRDLLRGLQSPGTYSWGGAASTLFWVDPALDMSVVLMLQRVPGFSSKVTEDLATSIYQAVLE